MNDINNWSIRLRSGIGLLQFGMSQKEVSNRDSDYGVPIRTVAPEDYIRTDINEFKDFLTEFGMDDELSIAEVESAVNLSESLSEEMVSIIDETRTSPNTLILEYFEDSLFMASTDSSNQFIHHDGLPIFSSDPHAILQHFQRLNGGGATVNQSDVLFDKIGLLLTGFYYQTSGGTWRFYLENDNAFEERFLTLFAPSELDRYLTDDFIDVDFLNK